MVVSMSDYRNDPNPVLSNVVRLCLAKRLPMTVDLQELNRSEPTPSPAAPTSGPMVRLTVWCAANDLAWQVDHERGLLSIEERKA